MQSRAKTHNNGRHKSRKRHLRWLIIVLGLGLTGVVAGVAGVIGVLQRRQLSERARVVSSFEQFDSGKTQRRFRELFSAKDS